MLGFRNFPQWKNIYCRCASRGFSLIDQKLSKLRGSELRRLWDIWGYLYSTETLRVYYDVVRTTLCGRICKGNAVRKILWDLLCEKDIVRKTSRVKLCEKDVKNNMYMYIGISYDNVGRMILWEKRCDNDVVQMILWANDDMRKKMWERRCEKYVETDIVRKKVWERHCRTDVIFFIETTQ